MRIPLLIAAALLIAATPVAMAKEKIKYNGAPVFGSTQCKPYFPCARGGNPESMSQMEQKAFSIAKKCLKRKYSAIGKSGSIFRESYGLDSNLCMKSRKQKTSGSGYSFTPKCCIKPVSGKKGQCVVKCILYAIR